MVVNVVNIAGVAGLESKDYAPVCGNGYCMKPPQGAVQCVQPPAWCAHVRRLPRAVERRQDQPQFDRVTRLNACARTVREKLGQAFVPEIPYHWRV
jgi:hypothetical protein